MKRILSVIFIVANVGLYAQAPSLINYQGLARDQAGNPVQERTIGLRFELKQGSGQQTIFSEEQTVTTNSLGLFTTQIGKIQGQVLDTIDWKSGQVFLETGVDINGGTNYVTLGTQGLGSVPYALYAQSVRSSVNGNSLTIGSVTHTLPVATTYTNGTGIGITSGTVITNTAPDMTITLQAGTNVSVAGVYPDFTVTATPALNVNGDDLDISGGNTVTIAPTLSYTSPGVLRVGPATNTVLISASPTIQGTGIASVTTSGMSYTVDVITPTLMGTGASSVSGTFPNYTIDTPTPVIIGVGASNVTGTYPNYSINTPTPVITGLGASNVTGTYPNYSINTPTPVITGVGSTSVTGTYPNYSVNTPSPIITGVGATSVTGTYPNYSVNTPSPVITGVGATSVTGTYPNYSVNTPSPVITGVGATSVTGTYPNYSVNTPSPVITGVGATSVTGTYPNYSVNTPSPIITGVGATSVTGTYPNYSVNTPSPVITGVGATSVTGTYPNYSVNTPSPVITGVGATSVTGTYPNYSVNTPSPIITGVGATSVTGTYPNYTIDTPAPTFTGTGGITVNGTYPTYTINGSTTSNSIVGTGATTVSGTAPSFTIDTPTPTITGTGATSVSGTYPNFAINTPSTTLLGIGIATVTGTSPNYTVNATAPTFSGTGGITVSGTYPTYTINNSTTSNSIVGTGATTVSGTAPSFTIDTPTPTITGTGATSVSGTYPNYAINTPSTSLLGVGATTVTGTFPNYSINTPSTNITGAGATSVTGTYPNYAINTPSTNLLGTGATTVTGTFPNYTIDTPAPTFTGTGGITVNGTYPTYTINSTVASNSIVGTGATTVTGTAPSFTIDTPTPTITGTGATSVSGTYPNYAINTPSPVLLGTGATTVTGAFPNYSIDTPAPTFTGTGGITVNGTYPTYTINNSVASNSIVGTGATTVSGTAPSFTIDTPTPTITGTGATSVSGTYPNYAINTPSPSLLGTGVTTVTGTFPNYTIDTPAPTFTGTGATAVNGTYPNYTINTQSTSIVATGATTLTGAFPSYTLDTPAPTFTGTGGITVNGTYPTYTINGSSVSNSIVGTGATTVTGTAPSFTIDTPTPTITGTGATSVSGTYPNYTIDSPVPSINGSGATMVNGIYPNLTIDTPPVSISGTGATTVTGAFPSFIIDSPVMVDPPLTFTNDVLTVGAVTNSVSLPIVWSRNSNSVSIPNQSDLVGIGTANPQENLQIESTGGVQLSLIGGTTSGLMFGTTSNHAMGHILYDHSAQSFNIWTNNTPNRLAIDFFGNVGIGTSSPVSNLDVAGNLRLGDGMLFLGAVGGVNSGYTGVYSDAFSNLIFATAKAGAPATAFAPGGNSIDAVVIKANTGNVGIGTTNPTAKLHIEGTIKIRDGSQGFGGKVLTCLDTAGNATWATPVSSGWSLFGNAPSPTDFIGTTNAQDLVLKSNNTAGITIFTTGIVGINAPPMGGQLNVIGSTLLKDAHGVVGSVYFNSASNSGGTVAGGFFVNNYAGATGGGADVNAGVVGLIDVDGGSNSQFNTGGWMKAQAQALSIHDNLTGLVGSIENHGTIDKAYGGYFHHLGNTGTINNGYGVYIGNVHGNNKWSLFASDASAENYFAGNVGIGTTNPSTKLHIEGNIKIRDGNQSYGRVLTCLDTAGNATWQTPVSSGWNLFGNAASPGSFIGTTNAEDFVIRANSIQAITVFTTGNIGIGAFQPGGRLNVAASTATPWAYGIHTQIDFNPSTNPGGVVAAGYFSNVTNGSPGSGTQFNTGVTGNLQLYGSTSSQYNAGGWMRVISSGTHDNITSVVNTIENSGNITNAFGAYFTQYNTGTINNSYGVYIDNIQGSNKWSLYAADASANNYLAGKTGIGVSPTYKLHVLDANSSGTVLHSENNFVGTNDGYGIFGRSVNADGFGYGGLFQGGWRGVHGEVVNSSYNGGVFGVSGLVTSTSAVTSGYGVWGQAMGGAVAYGLYGTASGATVNWAGYFIGDVQINGTLSKSAGTFKIDHPQDPANKYLIHSFVESPDMMNVYNGNIVTDANGLAIVGLPSYFEAENKDFKYQLTVIGQFAQAIVLNEISENQFTIKTDKPSVKVSWQVTGVRNDEYAKQHRIVPEVNKTGGDVGKYLNPELFGQRPEQGIGVPAKETRERR